MLVVDIVMDNACCGYCDGYDGYYDIMADRSLY
jgi:hypothetical protein